MNHRYQISIGCSIAVLFFVSWNSAAAQAIDPEITVTTSHACKISDELRKFSKMNPEESALLAIDKNDLRYIAFDLVYGFPGVKPKGSIAQNCLFESVNYRQYGIISDFIRCGEQEELQSKAQSIAASYNKIIQKARRKQNLDKCTDD